MPSGILRYTAAACTIRNFDVKVLQIHGTFFAYPKVWILDFIHFMHSRFYFDASI